MAMRYPLTLHTILERARLLFPNKEIVSCTASGVVRHTCAQYYART